jgi:23S rRNA (cytidine1920-2'-O)/16S rRNA (cytidine1409-2'-O)-methyltransferase
MKLRHALTTFAIDPTGWICADLGCSTGGFTDCLLQAGAARVHSVDTAYGQLAWKLRKDARVVVTERSNALHTPPPPGGVSLVVCDLGWTPQRLLIPAAVKWLSPGGSIISLIKPHYELRDQDAKALPRGGILDESVSRTVNEQTLALMPSLGVCVKAVTPSPLLGGEHKGKGTGNIEFLAWLSPLSPVS